LNCTGKTWIRKRIDLLITSPGMADTKCKIKRDTTDRIIWPCWELKAVSYRMRFNEVSPKRVYGETRIRTKRALKEEKDTEGNAQMRVKKRYPD